MATEDEKQYQEECEMDSMLEGHHKVTADHHREEWNNRLEYILSLIGYTVGLGSVWRFPYLCLKNGGGAFLIPFTMFTLMCGAPLFYMELALGQFYGKSASATWSICPLFEGIGYAMMVANGIGAWYYCLVVAWVLLYLGYAFFPTQPWSTCNNDWNSDQCVVLRTAHHDVFNYTESNYSTFSNVSGQAGVFPTASTEFFRYKLLNISPGIEILGSPQLQLVLAFFAANVSIFLCIVRGVKSVGKVVYVTVTAPFILLLTLLVRSLLLEGSLDGVLLYLTPDFTRLWNFQVWLEAAIQVFYSLGPSFGGVITMASYQKFSGNIMRDTAVVVAVDLTTNFLCGVVVFSVLGFLAHDAGLSIAEVADSGPGLVFLVYPEVLQRLPLPQLWAVIFFFLLFTVGLDTLFCMLETVISGVMDKFPKALKGRKYQVLLFFFVLYFTAGLIFTTQGGVYVFQLIDWYLYALCIFVISTFECLIIGWIYGAERFSRDIKLMTGKAVNVIVRASWCIVTPVVMMVAFITAVIGFEGPIFTGYKYPEYTEVIGLCLAILPIVPIPLVALIKLYYTRGSFKERLQKLVTSSSEWGPHDQCTKKVYEIYKYKGNFWQNAWTNIKGTN